MSGCGQIPVAVLVFDFESDCFFILNLTILKNLMLYSSKHFNYKIKQILKVHKASVCSLTGN